MKISTEISSTACNFGAEKSVELIARAGFDHFDFSMFSTPMNDGWGEKSRDYILKTAENIRKTGLKNGITCNQSHAPFPVMIKEIYNFLPTAIEATAVAGGKICVVHPNNDLTPEQNAVMYKELMPVAHKFGVKVATENMWNWSNDRAADDASSHPENLREHVDAVGDDFMGACVDIGHAEMFPDSGAANIIKALGSRVIALHVHDNDLWHDSHQLPGTMKIDFDPVTTALREIGYKGEMTLECGTYVCPYNKEEDALSHLRDMADVARKLAEKSE